MLVVQGWSDGGEWIGTEDTRHVGTGTQGPAKDPPVDGRKRLAF